VAASYFLSDRAAKKLTPTLEKAGEAIKRFASKLKPQVDYDLADQTLRITLGASEKPVTSALPLLTDVLNIIDNSTSSSAPLKVAASC
jgi:hypothetical protein